MADKNTTFLRDLKSTSDLLNQYDNGDTTLNWLGTYRAELMQQYGEQGKNTKTIYVKDDNGTIIDTLEVREDVLSDKVAQAMEQGVDLRQYVMDQEEAIYRATNYYQKPVKYPTFTTLEESVNDDIPIIDKDWIGSRFMVPVSSLAEYDQINIFHSSTGWKFESTQLGHSLAINPRPQFTRTCDIRGNSVDEIIGDSILYVDYGVEKKSGIGMGRYYSEAIDDNATKIFMEFGVARFNSLIDFFTGAITYEDAYIANHGRLPIGYSLGVGVGGSAMFCAFPLMSITIYAVKLVAKIFDSQFDYYYMEPAMHSYWGMVNETLTKIVTELGWFPTIFTREPYEAKKIGLAIDYDKEDMAAMADAFPDLITTDTHYIDVFAISQKHQKMANQLSRKAYQNYIDKESTGNVDIAGYVRDEYKNTTASLNAPGQTIWQQLDAVVTFSGLLQKLTKNNGLFANTVDDKSGFVTEDSTETTEQTEQNVNINKEDEKWTRDGKGRFTITEQKQSWLDNLASSFDSVVRDGAGWAIFQVDYQGSVSESFSNSYSDISTMGTQKSIAQAGRNMNFNLAGGNVIFGLDKAVDLVKNFVAGAADSITFGLSNVVTTIFGNGYIDMPKKWDDSSVDFPTITYTMQLRSPYGTPFSLIKNIYLPLSMILVGALPQAVGKASYTSPFLCNLFNKGVQNIKLGMITSLTIERAVDNLPFSKNKMPLGMDISFTVTDFSNIVATPVTASIFGNIFNVIHDDQTTMGRYLGTIASRDIISQKYMLPKIKKAISRIAMYSSQSISAANWGMRIAGPFMSTIGLLVGERSLDQTQSSPFNTAKQTN